MSSFIYLIIIPALAPVFMILFFVYSKDRLEREPFRKVAKVFLMSALFTFAVVPFERLAGLLVYTNYRAASLMDFEFAENFWGVAFVEELYKCLILLIFIWGDECFNFRYDGIVYAVTASLGFAALENVLYVMSIGPSVALGRALFSIPGHASFGVFMGFFFARAKHRKNQGNVLVMLFDLLSALASATLAHAIYDFLLSDSIQGGGLGLLFFLYVFVMDVIAWMLIYNDFETDRRL